MQYCLRSFLVGLFLRLRAFEAVMKKILVIEDESQTREIFLRCLTFEGFCALGAESGTIGVKLAKMHLPDLIVCDIMMPDLDGYSVLTTLRQELRTAAIPLIFLTAKVTMADLRYGMELGADDYLIKPCTVEQLLSAITTRLKRHDALKQWYAKTSQENSSTLVAATNTSLNTNSSLDPFSEAAPSTNSDAIPASQSIFPDCPKLAQVFQFIEAHYDQPIRLTDVAQAVGYSPAYLTNLVQSQTGRTVKRWITERRMVQARKLLTTTAQPVNQIAEIIGYTDVNYFIRQFRQFHSVSPQAWRNIAQNQVQASAG